MAETTPAKITAPTLVEKSPYQEEGDWEGKQWHNEKQDFLTSASASASASELIAKFMATSRKRSDRMLAAGGYGMEKNSEHVKLGLWVWWVREPLCRPKVTDV